MQKLIFLLALALVVAVGAGCAATKPLTPEEIAAERDRQMKMITRVYVDKKPEEVLLAADRVFRLADDDYEVSHSPTALQAQRNWTIFLVISASTGIDTWIVEAYPAEVGTKVIARHSGQASAVTAFASPVVGGGNGMAVGAITSPALQNMTIEPAIYELFFARLDYLLGKRADWLTCKEAKKLAVEGYLDPFCTVANDRTPDGKSAAQRREMQNKEKDDSGVSVN